MSGLNTHTVTLAHHYPMGGGPASAGWMCSCGDHGYVATMSLAAQRFAEHYALAKQQAAPKVRRNAPAHDGGRTLTMDTIRASERAVLLSLPETRHGFTDASIRYYAGTERVRQFAGMFSDSRLRTARVELQRAGLVEATGDLSVTDTGRRARMFRLTEAGVRLRREVNAVASMR